MATYCPRLIIALAVVSLLALSSARSYAEEPRTSAAQAHSLDLTWTAPPSCPTQGDVKTRIDGLLGTADKPASSVAESATADAKLRRTRGGYKLALTLRAGGTEGTRTLIGQDCAELAETAAFLIAVAIDPTLPGATPPVAEPAPPPPPPVPEPPPPPPPRAPRSVEVPLPFALQASGFGGLWSAGLPKPRPQVGGSLGIAIGRVQLELRGADELLTKISVARDPERPGIIDVRSVHGELAACYLWGERFFAGPCGAVAAVQTFARARGFEERKGSSAQWWASAALTGQAGIRVTAWLEAYLEGGLGLPFSKRPHFEVKKGDGTLKDIVGDRLVPYGRLGVRFRWQPTRTVAAP